VGRRKLIEDTDLLARVREIVVREGTAVSSHKIASEIGISSAVLFQRFGSKENLLFAAMVPPAPDMGALLGGSDQPAAVQLEQLALGLLSYFRQVVPVMLPLASNPAFDFEAFRRDHPGSPLETLMGELMAAWEEKRLAGEIDCPEVGPLVIQLVAVAYSLALFERMGIHGGTFSEETVRALARLTWRGIATLPPER
jgi:AcrR family transcriptional regulator